MNTGLRKERKSGLPAQGILICSVSALILTLFCGCGSPKIPIIGPVQFVDSTGASVSPTTSLAVNGVIYLVATVTNDHDLLGVSWTVSCGSQPPGGGIGTGVISTACGVFTPAQTTSGPVPSYPSTGIIAQYTAPSAIPKGTTVTITAHATALPSVVSTATVTIVASPAGNTARLPALPHAEAKGLERTGL